MLGRVSLLRFATFALSFCILASLGIGTFADSSATYIIFTIEDSSENPALAWLGEGIALSITEQIGIPGVKVIDYEKKMELTDDLDLPPSSALSHASMIRLAERAPADFLVMGTFSGTDETLHISLRVLDLKTMRLGGEISANGQLSVLPQMENELAWLILSNSGMNGTYSREEFKKRTRLIPDASFAYFVRSLTISDEDSKLRFLSKAVELTPNFPEARFLLGKNYFEKADWQEAAKHFEYALKSGKRAQEAEFMLGICYYQRNFFEQSVRSYSHLLMQRASPEVLNNLGAAYLRKGEYSMALQKFLEAQELARTSATVNLNLGLLWHLQSDNTSARAVLEEAIRSNPDNGMLYYIFSKVLAAQGEADAAKLALEKARHLGINVEQIDREDPRSWARIFLERDRHWGTTNLDNEGVAK